VARGEKRRGDVASKLVRDCRVGETFQKKTVREE